MWGNLPVLQISVVAVGDIATGLVAIDGVAIGLLSAGGCSEGLVAIGAVAIGVVAVDAISIRVAGHRGHGDRSDVDGHRVGLLVGGATGASADRGPHPPTLPGGSTLPQEEGEQFANSNATRSRSMTFSQVKGVRAWGDEGGVAVSINRVSRGAVSADFSRAGPDDRWSMRDRVLLGFFVGQVTKVELVGRVTVVTMFRGPEPAQVSRRALRAMPQTHATALVI
jgi:hypothetical protein